MLIVNNVTKLYKKEAACNHVSFEVPDGKITVLLGPNGAGKSTIMKSIIGFLKYQGSIMVGEHDNRSIEARRILGYVPEIPSLYKNLTVKEHMEFVAKAYRLKKYSDYIEELLERFELHDKEKKFGDELSKGMQQKLSLCMALLPNPDILLMDEPMIGLDPHAIKEIKKLMIEMRDKGKSLIISTHIIDSVDGMWDKAIIMQKGEIKGQFTKEELQEQGKKLEQVFFEVTEGTEDYSLNSEKQEKSHDNN